MRVSKRHSLFGGIVLIGATVGMPQFFSSHAAQEITVLNTARVVPASTAVEFGNEPLKPLPAIVELNQAAVALGKRLFNERMLSADGSLSCASCHNLALGGVDRLPHSRGIHGAEGPINAPTVYNSALNFIQFWDGRAATLEEQALGPIQNPKEMGSKLEEVVKKLEENPDYNAEFNRTFGTKPSPATIAAAISAYERTLTTANSPFDRYLQGDAAAIDATAKEGYRLFKAFGCVACHQGANVGGNMFQQFGAMGDYFADRGNPTDADNGRYNVTHRESDRYVFKVPSLRNAELTAPYFHDGTAQTLDQAVRVMAKYQLGRVLSNEEAASIVAFLHSLKGDQPQ